MAGATWIPDEPSGPLPVRQVYAFVFVQDGRLWVPPPLVDDLLGWGETGSAQVVRAVHEARTLGAVWHGAPLADPEPSWSSQ